MHGHIPGVYTYGYIWRPLIVGERPHQPLHDLVAQIDVRVRAARAATYVGGRLPSEHLGVAVKHKRLHAFDRHEAHLVRHVREGGKQQPRCAQLDQVSRRAASDLKAGVLQRDLPQGLHLAQTSQDLDGARADPRRRIEQRAIDDGLRLPQ